MQTLARDAGRLLIEVGPGNTLKTLARQTLPGLADDSVLASLPHPLERVSSKSFARRALGRAWLAGVPVNWEAAHAGRSPRRVALPTYPFESKRFWVEPLGRDARAGVASIAAAVGSTRKKDLADWFWLPSWQRSSTLTAHAAAGKRAARGRWLVFADDTPAAVALLKEMSSLGIGVVEVRRGESFAALGANRYNVRPDRRDDYDQLLAAVLPADASIDGVLHLWNAGASESGPVDTARGRRDGFYSTLYLAQALGDVGLHAPLPVLVVSTDMQRVLGTESLRIERTLLIGPVLVMSQDVPYLRSRSIDVAAADWTARSAGALAKALVAEAAVETSAQAVAYRSGYRWEQAMNALRVEAPAADAVPLREEGAYLITGGTGGLGLAIARNLARTLHARLVLTARSAMPERNRWADLLSSEETAPNVKARIRAIQELEELGAEVLVASADVADAAAMAQIIAAARKRFGTVHGVIHAAGLPGIGILPLKTPQAAEKVLRPKVEGTLVIDELLAGANLDFLVLFSTTNTAFGWHGTTDYSSANAFLDAFAQAGIARCSRRVVTINWGTWREVGMAADLAAERGESDGALMRSAIAPEEGSEALRRALASEFVAAVRHAAADAGSHRRDRRLDASDSGEPSGRGRSRRSSRRRARITNALSSRTNTWHRVTAKNRSSPPCGATCSAYSRWARRTISSISVATHCWPHACSPGCRTSSRCACPCG